MLFFLALIVLFTMLAQRIEWNEVFDTLADFKVRTLIIASGLTLVSFLVYACFDLIGRTYIRQDLTWKQILPVGIISYAFNLNLSAWVGGIAMRYRLYSRLGVSKSNIAKILGLSLATNWFGYMVIAGAVFSSGLVRMPPGWKLSSGALQGVGVLLLLVSAGYLAACQFSKRREWSIRGVEINLPSAAHGGAAIGPWGVELVADGGGDFHVAAEQAGLSAGAGGVVDQRDCRGDHAHSGGAWGAGSGVCRTAAARGFPGEPGGGVAGVSGDLFHLAAADYAGDVSGGRGQGQVVADLEKTQVIGCL